MKKLLFPLLLSVALLAAALPASGATLGQFSFVQPEGWKPSLNEKGTLIIESPTKQCAASFNGGPTSGKSSKAIAEELSKQYAGGEPEPLEGLSPGYWVQGKTGDVPIEATVYGDGESFFIFVQAGECDEYEPELEAIWNSLRSTDPKISKLLTGK